jgi:inorganic pyrophosphatase
MTMIDHGQPDHKVIAVLNEDPIYSEFEKASDFPKHIFKMLRNFFEEYKTLEGKEVAVDEILPTEAAHAIIEDALARYWKARRTGGIKGLIT